MQWENGNGLLEARQAHPPLLLSILSDLTHIQWSRGSAPLPPPPDTIKTLFPLTSNQPLLTGQKGPSRACKPLRVGVVLSGGQASGGHNVIIGIYDALKQLNPHSRVFGFLGGPSGIIAGKNKELTADLLAPYRNTGGFDMIGSGRTKIQTEEQLNSALDAVSKMQLDGLVIIGGDDSNTNAAVLAEYFMRNNCSTRVVGVPKTIDGDLKNAHIEISFGFDTACKVYSEMIGNIARDAQSARKYYHFIKLMGRSASHIALECALATRPNLTLIGEEVAAEKKTLIQLTHEIADLICQRAEAGKQYGVILIPEGLIEFIPEMSTLIQELNQILLSDTSGNSAQISSKLTPSARQCFSQLPARIQEQLLMHRDPHGNVYVSGIETERLLMEMVGNELQKRQVAGRTIQYFPVQHFFGYEGRAGFPSHFDCNYCYALGFTATLLIDEGITGYMAAVTQLTKHPQQWGIAGVPLTAMMHTELRKGKETPVIQKALVDLKGAPFTHFQRLREQWRVQDAYRFPGPIQFFGPPELTQQGTITLLLERG